MKLPVLLSLLLAGPLSAQEPSATPANPAAAPAPPPSAAPPRDTSKDLARPLRKYDKDKDGKLTGDEMRMARQAFNRGGKDPEMSSDDWQGVLDYLKGEWRRRNYKKLDSNGDDKLDDAEKARIQTIWGEIASRLTSARAELVLKYDKNDDGNVTRDERRAFDPEFNRRRGEIENEITAKFTAPPPPAPAAAAAVIPAPAASPPVTPQPAPAPAPAAPASAPAK